MVPLNKIQNEDEINENYRYRYIPLLLMVLEKEIGEDRLWNWLNYILINHQSQLTNYNYFKESLLKSGVKEMEFKNFENLYISSGDATINLINRAK